MKTYTNAELRQWIQTSGKDVFAVVMKYTEDMHTNPELGHSNEAVVSELGNRLHPLIPDADFGTMNRVVSATLASIQEVVVGELMQKLLGAPLRQPSAPVEAPADEQPATLAEAPVAPKARGTKPVRAAK